MTNEHHIPPMPDGFTDSAAWDAIHFEFRRVNGNGPLTFMSGAVMQWQRENQERVLAAIVAKATVSQDAARATGERA